MAHHDNSSPSDSAPTPVRSIAEIEADLDATRTNLIATVEQLQESVRETFSPRRIIEVQIGRVRGFYIDEYGGVRPERVVVSVGIVVGFVVVRGVFRRGTKNQ